MKGERKMSILAVIIAVIIFANPYLSVIDIFPDVIGCMLIWYALRRVEFFSPKLEEARAIWLKLAFITAADALVSFLIISSNDQTMILLDVFVFRTSEAVMMYLAATKTFDGTVYLGTKFDGDGIYMRESKRRAERRTKRENAAQSRINMMLDRERERYERETAACRDEEQRRRATERYKRVIARLSADANRTRKTRDIVTVLSRATRIFIVIRTLLCVLPEFTVLSSYQYLGNVTSGVGFDISRYRPLFIILGFFVSAVAGVIWLVFMLRYIGGIRRDKQFCVSIREAFNEYAVGHDTHFTCRRLITALLFLSIGVILTLDLNIDHKNFIPDYAAAAFFIFFFLTLFHDIKTAKRGIILSAIYGAASVAKAIMIADFIGKYDDFTRTYNSAEAQSSHLLCCLITLAAEIVFIALAVTVFSTLKEIITSHTGITLDDGQMTTSSVTARKALNKSNKRMLILAVISSAASVAWMIVIGINKQVIVANEFGERVDYVPVFTPISIVTVIITLVFIVYAVKYISDLTDEIKERYRYI